MAFPILEDQKGTYHECCLFPGELDRMPTIKAIGSMQSAYSITYSKEMCKE